MSLVSSEIGIRYAQNGQNIGFGFGIGLFRFLRIPEAYYFRLLFAKCFVLSLSFSDIYISPIITPISSNSEINRPCNYYIPSGLQNRVIYTF
jgi:hypothetical protein